jgi:CRP-like cAMP-binding protein
MNLTPSEKLKKFFVTSKPIFYKKGEVVLRVGETRLGAFYVKSGYVKDLSVSSDGRNFNLFIFEPGDLFSYNWIYNKTPNEHTFKAMTDCTAYEKAREELLQFREIRGRDSDVVQLRHQILF